MNVPVGQRRTSHTPQYEPQRDRSGMGHIVVLLLYGLASLALTWPLARRFATHMAGNGIDDPALGWNLWWIKTRLVDQVNPDIFHVEWMFHPIDINLAFYTLTPLNGLLSVPLQTSASLIVANNLLLLSSFVLSGYGLFLLARGVWAESLARLPASTGWWVAWVGGLVYAFAAPKLFYAALGQYNIASSHWLPFCLLYLWRVLHSPTGSRALRNGALAGLFLTLQAWAELTYASFLILVVVFIYLWVTLAWVLPQRVPHAARLWQRMTGAYAATGGIFLLGISPFLSAMLPDLRVEGDFFASGGGFADAFSADLAGYLLPVPLHPLMGDWTASLPIANAVGQQIFLGYSVILLAAIGWWAAQRTTERATAPTARRTANLWLGLLVLAFLLTLGPALRIWGQELPIPGPFALVSRLPFFSGNRYPSRYSVVLLAAAAVLTVRGLIFVSQRLRPSRAAWFLAAFTALFVAEHLVVPLPLTDYRVPTLYQQLAAQPGDFALLELPTGWRNGARVLGRSDELIMLQQWYQTTHGKPRLGGNTSRNPAYKFQYFSEEPLLADLIALMNADRDHLAAVLEPAYDEMAARGRLLAPDLLDFLGVRYVLLHADEAPELLARFVEDALPVSLVDTWQGVNWRGEPATIRLYMVNPPRPAPTDVNAGDSLAHRYLAEGWSPLGDPSAGRYATRATPALLLDLPTTGATVTLTYGSDQAVGYTINGYSLGSYTGATHTLAIPPHLTAHPVDRLALTFQTPPMPAAQWVSTPSPIGQTGANLEPGLALMARSAGEEVGNFATVHLNGTQLAPNSRGYNLVALAADGAVLDSAVFDTHDPSTSDPAAAMAAWLAQWPRGTVIAGAVADEASMSLSEEAVTALRGLGVTTDLRGQFRHSHAFIGVQGAAAGSAVEATGLTMPASVWLGAPVDAASVYGPLRSIAVRGAQ